MTAKESEHDSLATCWITPEILDSLENKAIREKGNYMTGGEGVADPWHCPLN